MATFLDKARVAVARQIVGKRLFGVGKDQDFYGFMGGKFGTDAESRNKLSSYKGIVYACVSLIGESMGGQYEPQLKVRKGDHFDILDDHPLLALLRNPSGNNEAEPLSQFDLFEATASFIALQGECYWYMVPGRISGEPKEIVILRPDKVGIDIDDYGNVQGYFIRRMTGDPIPLEVDEILHFKMFNPKNPYHGMSPIDAGEDEIATDQHAKTFTRNFFRNNAGLSGVLNVKGEVTKNAFQKFVRAWRDKYEGVDNAGKVAIVRDSEAAFTKVGLGLDELDMKALRDMSKDDVRMLYKVPKPLLGDADGAGLGRGNVETLEYIFAKYNLDPKMVRFDSILQFALKRYWKDTTTIVDHVNIIPADKEHELNEKDKAVDRWKTRNEIREEDGLDSVDGGDDLRANISTYAISDDLAEPEDTTDEDPPADPPEDEPTDDDEPEEDSEKAIGVGFFGYKIIRTESGRLALVRIKSDGESKKKDTKTDTTSSSLNENKKENFRLSLMRNQTKYEKKYRKAVIPILEKQEREAIKNLEAKAGEKALTKDFDEKLFDDEKADKEFQDELTPVLEATVATQGALALIYAGEEEKEFKVTQSLLKIIEDNTAKMAKNFNDETLAKLNATLADGVSNGESLSKLKKRVEAVYSKARGYRSLRIARTETLKASNDATNDAYEQTGYVKEKKWYANPGHCKQCEAFDGKSITLKSSFLALGETYTYTDEEGNEKSVENSYDSVDNPPLHPSCRCTIIPVR
ncbi:MAG: phage portal protein [Candidatus Paceibacterota bacterium]|jgi:HK97 family phage portal protein